MEGWKRGWKLEAKNLNSIDFEKKIYIFLGMWKMASSLPALLPALIYLQKLKEINRVK